MKLYLLAALSLALSAPAFAYDDGGVGDPAQGFRDVQTKTVVKSATAGYSDAISKGNALFYEDGSGVPAGLYTVSRDTSLTYNVAATVQAAQACIAKKDVATGDVGGFPCVTQGYVDYALYSVDSVAAPILVGGYLCISDAATSKGRLVPCGSGVVSQFIALEAKSAVADGTMKVRVKSQ